ncbi:MAG: glycerol-3-phosphate 1-O-acyltransferase PlsY [Armatimonadota bacterium]
MTGVQGLGLALAYLIGAVPVGLTVGLLLGTDPRKVGSGNIGATNVLRALGPGVGLGVFIADVLKGVAAVALCASFGMDGWLLSMAALFATLGHCFSVFIGFKGGKGVATSLGGVIMLSPLAAAIAFAVWLITVLPTRIVSLASLLGALTLPIAFYALNTESPESVVPLVAMALVVIGRHHENIERILRGEESRFGGGNRQASEAAANQMAHTEEAEEE